MKREVLEDYIDWLFDIIDSNNRCQCYEKMLKCLLDIPFEWSIDHDENRNEDGLNLRYKFADEEGVDEGFFVGILPEESSVLEMLIALSIRVEDEISDPRYSGGPAVWFWEIIKNIGLSGMFNENYDEDYIYKIIDILLKRQYESDGTGGYFKTINPEIDMRKTEIWYQVNVWIEENFEF